MYQNLSLRCLLAQSQIYLEERNSLAVLTKTKELPEYELELLAEKIYKTTKENNNPEKIWRYYLEKGNYEKVCIKLDLH